MIQCSMMVGLAVRMLTLLPTHQVILHNSGFSEAQEGRTRQLEGAADCLRVPAHHSTAQVPN